MKLLAHLLIHTPLFRTPVLACLQAAAVPELSPYSLVASEMETSSAAFGEM